MRKRLVYVVFAVVVLLVLSHRYFDLKTSGANPSMVKSFSKLFINRKTFLPIQPAMGERIKKAQLPQIIGIGSKKCGTGAFKMFLNIHSRVHLPNMGEPHFFDETYEKGPEYYKSLMPKTGGNDVIYEKSPKYFVTKQVPQRIKETYEKENVPTPKFVLVVCDPVERAFSDFVHRKETGQTCYPYEPENFDEFIDLAFSKIKKMTPTSNKAQNLYKHMDALNDDCLLQGLMTGVYSYFLQHWLKYFRREDFIIVDGRKLLTNPGQVMVQAQKDLGLAEEVQPHHFVFLPKKGFFCCRVNSDRQYCLDERKGRTRKVDNNTVTQPGLSSYARGLLKNFYRPFNDHFSTLTQTHIL